MQANLVEYLLAWKLLFLEYPIFEFVRENLFVLSFVGYQRPKGINI